MPEGILEAAEMYAGCVSGASEKGSYLGIIKSVGFKNIQLKKERRIELPDELLLKYISAGELETFKNSDSGIYSITVYAEKLGEGECCDVTDEGCCGSDVSTSDKNEKTGCCDTSSNDGVSNCC